MDNGTCKNNTMNELSQRLQQAVAFLKEHGYARFDNDIARKVGVTYSTMNMAVTGFRTPTWDLLLKFCDNYPISFDWIRTGVGSMIKGGDREYDLLRRIEALESRIRELEGQ